MTYEDAVKEVEAPVIEVVGPNNEAIAKAICEIYETKYVKIDDSGNCVVHCNKAVEDAICMSDEKCEETCLELEQKLGFGVRPEHFEF